MKYICIQSYDTFEVGKEYSARESMLEFNASFVDNEGAEHLFDLHENRSNPYVFDYFKNTNETMRAVLGDVGFQASLIRKHAAKFIVDHPDVLQDDGCDLN